MKILYSCLSRSWGGMEMFTLTAIRQLLKRNYSVELICYPESRIHIEANNMGIMIHPIKASGYFHPVQVLKLSNLIKKGNYDLVHTQASKDLWVLVPALKLASSKIPLILTKQVGSFIVKKDFLHKWIYNRVTFTLAISEIIRINLLETCPIPEEKVLLLHNAVDTEKFSPEKGNREKIRNEFSISDETIVIGMIARFTPGKGHEEFLKAANILSANFKNMLFMIVGEASRGEDEYEVGIKNLADSYKINILFTGFRSDTVDILSAMDIFVFPSHSEAFGIALVEAMAMGIPSICSNANGALDIAVDEITSLYFENKNGDDLAVKLQRLINDAKLRVELGKESRERAVKFFDLEVLTEKVIDIYHKSIKKSD